MADGRGEGDSWTIRIPEGVREVIGRRLDRLTERCNETLTIASVIGREFTLAQLKPLVEEMTEDRLLEVLEEALASRVVEELPQSVGRYQFTHALIQETLSGELTTTRRVRLHGRIAEALEALYGDDAEAHAAELAHHFAEAQTVLGKEKLVRYSLLAGERALASYGYEEATGRFQRALDAKGVPLAGSEPAGDQETAALLFGLGRAQVATAERHLISEAIAILRRALDYYAEAGDVTKAVAVAELPVRASAGHGAGMNPLIARALALVEPDSHQAGRLLARYGYALAHGQGNDEDAQEALGKALAIAEREGDLALEMYTLGCGVEVDASRLRAAEGLEKALRVIELGRQVYDPDSEVASRWLAAGSSISTGNLQEARLHAEAALPVAERLGNRQRLNMVLSMSVASSLLAGDWMAARQHSDRALAVSALNPVTLSLRILLEYELGDFSQGQVYLERLLEFRSLSPPGPTQEYAQVAFIVPRIAQITDVTRWFEAAEEAAAAVLSSPSALPLMAMIVRLGLALMAAEKGDVDRAAEQYPALESLPEALVYVIRDRVLGLLSRTMGNLDQAAAHFENALVFCRKAGYRPELAWTCCDYADLLLDPSTSSGGTVAEDRAKAMSLLDESLTISRELGMRPLMERVLSRREILGA